MPEFLSDESISFEFVDGKPLLRLNVAAPLGGTPSDWSMYVTAMMCVVDGPDDLGYLLPRWAGRGIDLTPDGWIDAMENDGGAIVAFGDPETSRFFVQSAW